MPAGHEVAAAWDAVQHGFSAPGFVARGGVYEWGQGEEMRRQQKEFWAAGGAQHAPAAQ